MTSNKKTQICRLLEGIETGDASSVEVVNQEKYIQHNPQTHEGGEGLAALFKRLSKTNPRVNIVRIFEDGDYVFAHTEYDFAKSNIGFEVFRFESVQAVEHWDNIQRRQGPNASGHTMINGPTEANDLDKTEVNRKIVASFVNEVLINSKIDALDHYIDRERYTEHNPRIDGGFSSLETALSKTTPKGANEIQYEINHRILAEGNFVLCVCEGSVNNVHSAFYDLFRLSSGKIVEHWDTTEAIAPRYEWKNNNGKF